MTKKGPKKSDRNSNERKKKRKKKKPKKKGEKKRKKKKRKEKKKEESKQKNNLLKYLGVIFVIGIIITASYFMFFYSNSENPEINNSSTNVDYSFNNLHNQTLKEVENSRDYVYKYQITSNNREESLEISVSGNRYYSEYEDQKYQYESYYDGQYIYTKQQDNTVIYREIEEKSLLKHNNLRIGIIKIDNYNFKLNSQEGNIIKGELRNLNTNDTGNLRLKIKNDIITSMNITDLIVRSTSGKNTTIIEKKTNLTIETVNIEEPEWAQALRKNYSPGEPVPLQELP